MGGADINMEVYTEGLYICPVDKEDITIQRVMKLRKTNLGDEIFVETTCLKRTSNYAWYCKNIRPFYIQSDQFWTDVVTGLVFYTQEIKWDFESKCYTVHGLFLPQQLPGKYTLKELNKSFNLKKCGGDN